jgi:hypothetical protein
MKRNDFILQVLGWTILILLIISPALLSAKTIFGSGEYVTVKEDIKDFDKIEISNSFNVRVNYAKDYTVTVQIDDNLQEYLIIEKVGKTLRIGLESGRSYRDVHSQALVTLPDICKLGLSGASIVTIKGFEFKHPFELHLSGASKVYGDLKTGDLEMHLSGASDVDLSGRGENLNISASGASTVTLNEFRVKDASLGLSGASKCMVNIEGELDVTASGSSKVKYCGPGSIGSVQTTGSSKIRKM